SPSARSPRLAALIQPVSSLIPRSLALDPRRLRRGRQPWGGARETPGDRRQSRRRRAPAGRAPAGSTAGAARIPPWGLGYHRVWARSASPARAARVLFRPIGVVPGTA